jgi:hypothetical protein
VAAATAGGYALWGPHGPEDNGGRRARGLPVGQPAPRLALPDVSGRRCVHLAAFRGCRPVVLVFGSYC